MIISKLSTCVSGPMKPVTLLTMNGSIPPRQAVAQRLAGRHVDAVVLAVGVFAPLARFEIHEVLGDAGERPLFGHRPPGVIEQFDRDVELGEVRLFGAGQALEHDLDGGAPFEAAELRLDVGQHADLRGGSGRGAHLVEMRSMAEMFSTVSMAGLTPMSASPPAQREPGINQQRDAAQIIDGMVGLAPRRERSWQAQRGAGFRDAVDLAGCENEVVHVHQLAHGGRHDTGEGESQRSDFLPGASSRKSLSCPSVQPASCWRNRSRSMSYPTRITESTRPSSSVRGRS